MGHGGLRWPIAVDVNGNGWLDIFACSYQGDVDRDINSFIYWNRGGNFEQFDRQDLITHATSGCIAAAAAVRGPAGGRRG